MKKSFINTPFRILKDPKDRLADYRDQRRPLTQEEIELEQAHELLKDQIDDD